MKKVSNHILTRVYLLLGFFVFFAGLIVLRVAGIQLDRARWVQHELEEQVFFKRVVADRGNILAEDGTILATSLPFYRIALDPTIIDTSAWINFSDSLRVLATQVVSHFEEPENDSAAIAGLYQEVITAMAENDRHVYLTRRKLNFEELEVVQEWPILRWGRFQGGMVIEKFHNERFYPMGDLAGITLGKLVDDTVGIRGIEHSFNAELRGRDGFLLAQKVVGNSYVPLDQYGKESAIDGYDIVTTLDVDLQDVTERALAKGVEKNQAKFGTAILIEVETGKIKALANYPESFNWAVATQIEPGSTFKLASAAALMEDNLIDLCDTVDTGDGRILYDDKEVTDNGMAWGEIDWEQVIAHSSNVGVSKTVNEFYSENPERFLWHLRNFGFYEPANHQLVGEPQPRIIEPGDKDWTIATLPSMSYGYSIGLTTLQMATFYNGLANLGRLMRPWMVQEIRDDSRVLRKYGPEVVNEQMISMETAIKVRELMKAVTDYGTASRQFRNMPFLVAGKTGTVRKTRNGHYVKEYRASFGGYFPADNPRYTLYIMIDEPSGSSASGGAVSAPVFREIAEEVYRLDPRMRPQKVEEDWKPPVKPAPRAIYAQTAKQLYEQLGIETSGVPDSLEWLSAKSNGHQVNLQAMDAKPNTIPNLRGMTSRDALRLLESMGVKVRLSGTGRVRRQSLLPGYRVGTNTNITLFLG